ncbi:MAG: ABC transporter ATP-binding protein [Elusimicrobia bacterium]|nr:ABC transporter ATP-binding protein [Candidatus Liberimonas magnetica]
MDKLPAILSVDSVSKTFEFKRENLSMEVLRGVSFSLDKGEFLSIIGPNGCGKTTLLYIIAGFLLPDKGRIICSGETVTAPSINRTVVFQEYGLFPWFTVEGNIKFGLRSKKLPEKICNEIAGHYIELLHLRGFEKKYPHQLSGGMKQRVSFARALAPDPDIVLMDEPFAALDSLTRETLQEEVLDIRRKTDKTFILITHDIDEAICLGDNVLVMTSRPGKVKEVVQVKIPGATVSEAKKSREFLEIKYCISSSVREEIKKTIAFQGKRLSKVMGNINLEKD